MERIRDYREKELVWFIIAYLLLLAGLSLPSDIITCKDLITIISEVREWINSILIAGVITSLSFVFLNVFPQGSMEWLVFFSKNKIPGKVIFSRIKNDSVNDMRFDNNEAAERYKNIINNMPDDKKKARKYENRNWYNLYNEHIDDNRVIQTNRDNLLSRDLYIVTVIMTVSTMLAFIFRLSHFHWVIVGYLLLMLVTTNIVARVGARRLVQTVIAVDLSKNRQK